MNKPLIVTALPQELANQPIDHDIPVIFTGIGKLNAAMALMDAIHTHQPTQYHAIVTKQRRSIFG